MFFDNENTKLRLNGVTYGPFAPTEAGPWPDPSQLQADMMQIRRLGFDCIRVYESPSDFLVEACRQQGLGIVAGIPWTQHVDFISQPQIAREAGQQVRRASRRWAHEPVISAFLVGNEIEKTLVRWMGPEQVREVIEDLISIVQQEAPGKLVSYASYPSTEYLIPRNADFVSFNVFLEKSETLAVYLQRLQNLAGTRPLVISEFGLDSHQHGEAAQAQVRHWFEEEAWRAGVAGRFWFSFTDEWHRGGEEVTGWDFGLVTRERREKEACRITPPQPVFGQSRISVVVCTHNGSATLRECLDGLQRQNQPPHEVIIVDDGSTDATAEIASGFPQFRYVKQHHAGLSAARNLGMKLATGEVIAYTDDDCIPDEDWVRHLSLTFDNTAWTAAGGPNLSPPPRNVTEACVAAAPGAPSEVLFNDMEAEHLPGCNLAIRKAALEAIGGFREEFVTAGDDVDVCWRLHEAGGRLRFVPAAFVWHHRRFTVKAYMRQQAGYGRSEAMLMRRYPQKFAWLGGARWRGSIYGDGAGDLGNLDRQKIYFGPYGLAPFQCVYAGWETGFWTWWRGLPWLFGLMLSILLGWSYGCGALLALGIIAAQRRAGRFDDGIKQPTLWQRSLLWFLCLAQPIVRDWARLKTVIKLKAWPRGKWQWPKVSWPWHAFRADKRPPVLSGARLYEFWSDQGVDRESLLSQLIRKASQFDLLITPTDNESYWDMKVTHVGKHWWLSSVTEYHESQRRLTRIALRAEGWLGNDVSPLEEWLAQSARDCGMSLPHGLHSTVVGSKSEMSALQPR